MELLARCWLRSWVLLIEVRSHIDGSGVVIYLILLVVTIWGRRKRKNMKTVGTWIMCT